MLQYFEVIPPVVRLVLLLACCHLLVRVLLRAVKNHIVHGLLPGTEIELLDGTRTVVMTHLPRRVIEVKQTDGRKSYMAEWSVCGIPKEATTLLSQSKSRKVRWIAPRR